MMAVTVIFVFGCKPEEPDTPDTPAPPTTVVVTGVSLNKTSLTITEGENETLSATVAPSNATNTAVSWSSSNTGVATVNNGQVTAVKAGTATITVTTSDGGKTASCSVTVEAKKIPVTGVSIDKETVELVEGEIVTNDLDFDSDRNLYILTGANRGGKTTITQAVGLMYVLAQCGMFVPATSF